MIVHIMQIYPQGTNSTFFTECCGVAICDDERLCPRCNKPVIGHELEHNYQRNKVRWRDATRFWKR